MILSKVKKSSVYKITKIIATNKDMRKLKKLGVCVGEQIFLVDKIAGGGVVVKVSGADIVFGKNISGKIEVESC